MGFEGANVLFDTWVQPLMMGLEEHLLGMFRGDFEFHEDAAPSHLGRSQPGTVATPVPVQEAAPIEAPISTPIPASVDAAIPVQAPRAGEPITLTTSWTADAERELGKVPFFVRGKARRNTERYALDHGLSAITVETLYDAKAHFSR
jgi:light-independent protochlorophyllide reductase subunit B